MNEPLGCGPKACRDSVSHGEVRGGTTMLRGKAAVRGIHVGIARVLLEDGDVGVDELQQGDVLVCRTMSRASFKLFGRIGALVTDRGGALSNAAILAREYGTPTVMATANGTDVIHDGQRIAVDGDRGIVSILP